MKQFKQESSIYTIDELLIFDACLYDLYKEKRPFFFMLMMLDKFSKQWTKEGANIDEVIRGLSHIS